MSTEAPARTTENVRAERSMRAADEAWEAGEQSRAEQAYTVFLQEFQGDALAPLAILGLARIDLASNSRDGAARAMERTETLRTHADSAVARKAQMLYGIALHRVGREREAIDTLSPLEAGWTVPEERALITATIAEAAESIGDTIAALRRLDALASAAADNPSRVQARAQIDAILESGAALAPSARAAFARAIEEARFDPRGYTWARAVERAVQVSAAEGDLPTVRNLVESLRREEVVLPEEVAAAAAQAERPASADPRVIGILLPFEQSPWEPAREMMRGLLLATEEPREGPARAGDFRLVWRGRVETEEAIRAEVRELVILHRAIAVLSTLDAAAHAIAATTATELDAPIVFLEFPSASPPCPTDPEFARRYADAFGTVPGLAAMAAYERVTSLRALISGGATSRSALSEALAAQPRGACAETSTENPTPAR